MSSGWSAPGAPGPEQHAAGDTDAPAPHPSPRSAGLTAPGHSGPFDQFAQHGPGPADSGPQRELVQQLPLFPLRPLGLGEVLGAAVRIYRLRARAALTLTAAVYGVAFVVITLVTGAGMIPFIGQMQAVIDDPMAEPEFSLVGDMLTTIGSTLVTGTISMVAAAVVTIALTRIAIGEASGDPLPSPQIWPTIRRFLLPAIVLAIITAVLGTIALLIPAALGALPLILSQEATVVTILALIFGVLIGILAAIWIWARTLLAIPALVIEECGPLTALRRGFAMTAGRKLWRVLGTGVLLYVLYMIATQVIAGVFGTIAAVVYLVVLLATQMEGVILGIALLTVISMIGSYVATFLIAPFYSAGVATVYADNRMRHEAWDIELNRAARSATPANHGIDQSGSSSAVGAPPSGSWGTR